ncbi:WbqC family protein [Legionella septentrionalis]|uniref:WbmP n=1 Tax=Legionella septentrionalis TaxID=2498109 RepID=A0A433JH19_9GAMM|nr:WbqC family protein [Legionella septentrionalis]RUQ81553.1 wbmP [Legionella septentrionalis]
MITCAIHQPNFFPWAGYFDKIRQADVFIFLDEVAYPKSGSGSGSWCNRVRLLQGMEPFWFGLPVQRQSGVQLIKSVRFADKDYHLKKLNKTLELNYKKYPRYRNAWPLIESLLNYPSDSLVEYNIHAIMSLSKWLGLKTRFIRQSELQHQKNSTELLIELVQQVGADRYLCGNGSSGYQEDALFKQAGIDVQYQLTNPAQHFVEQISDEESGLSILHLLIAHYDDFNLKSSRTIGVVST